ncbi:hypothetical protein JG688_00014939 [Phytophthora aleatoria]|uniref:Uncharacterized protein n=1 Tax=Phytophthora aleatoria TaxID=2496075 RepID=A0A8J5IWF0_9STRA|nr:hypothetical protein JG688_00014939 [Phytophthora aleatoria]
MKINAGKSSSELPLVPGSLYPFQWGCICTNGWKARVCSKGVRPSHTVKGTGCNGRCLAQLTEISKGTWGVQMMLPFCGLNHPLSRAGYTSYPSVRQLPASSPVMRDV